MRIQSLIFSLIIFLFPLVSLAGTSHDNGHCHRHAHISKSQAEIVAVTVIESFIEKKKVDSSWKSIGFYIEKKKFPNGLEWVVSFKNQSISDSAKQTIYVLHTLDGGYIAANYTGE